MVKEYCHDFLVLLASLLGTRHGLVEQLTLIYFAREKTIAMKVLGS